jgi:hypothetical protein
MPTSYSPYQPAQDLLLPPSLRDWLPQDHLAHYIGDTIDELDLSAVARRSAGAVLAGPSASPTPRRRTTSPIPTAPS